MMAYTVALIASPCAAARGSGSTAVEFSDSARVNLLPLPARNERGEGWGEGKPERKCPSSPHPSPPAAGGEGEPCALSAVFSVNSTAVGPMGEPLPRVKFVPRGGTAFGNRCFAWRRGLS